MLNIFKHFVILCVAFKMAKFLDLYLNYLRRMVGYNPLVRNRKCKRSGHATCPKKRT